MARYIRPRRGGVKPLFAAIDARHGRRYSPGVESQPIAGPERRIVTVLFADLVGFTSLAERLDPDDLAIVQDAYFAAVRDVVGRYRGRLEKFIGDAAMAAFGVPRTADDDAVRAVSAGFALLNAIGDLGARLGLDAEELRLRVGVNTGEVVVAVGGPDEGRLSGDVVNVAARLQAAAEPGAMFVGEVTALAVAGAVQLEPLAPLVLKGKAEPVRASRAIALRSEPSRELAMGRLRSPLMGRSTELAALRSAAVRAADGEAPRVLLLAPPGVGKTRLVEEFAATLEHTSFPDAASPHPSAGWSVLRVRVTAEPGAPFAPIARLVAAALDGGTGGKKPAPGDRLERLRAALVASGVSAGRAETVVENVRGLLAAQPGSAPAPPAPATTDRASLFLGWLQALEALAARTPQAWILEDLHWAGRDVLAFFEAAGDVPLQTAGNRSPASGRLVIATARPSVLETGAFADGWERIELPTLDGTDARALVDELTGSALPAALAEQIVARSDGNCLFIEEILRAWVGAGILVETGAGGVRLAVDPDEVPLPPTVQAVYAAQLDDLPGTARQAARRGSVCGRRFPVDVLPTLGIDAAPDAVAALGRRGIVGPPVQAQLVGDELAFRHALLRDAGYASLGRAERADLHVRTARWLEEMAGDLAGELAAVIGGHYADAVAEAPALAAAVAGGLDRATAASLAAGWLETAGDRALERGARAGAAELFRRSAGLTGSTEGVDRARRHRRNGEAIAGTGDLEEAAAAFGTAAELARQALDAPGAPPAAATGARRELALASAGLARARYEQIRFAEALAVADAALAVVGDDLPEAVPLHLARLRGIEGVSNDYTAVYRESERVLEAAVATGDPLLAFEARRLRLAFAANLGSETADEWSALAEEARALGRWSEAAGALSAASELIAAQDPSAAARLLDEAEATAEARGLSERLCWIGLIRASAALRGGDWEAGVAAARAGLQLAVRLRYDRAAVRTWFAVTPMAAARGDRATLEWAAAWFAEHEASFPHSPYGTVQHAGVDLRLADAGLGDPPALDDETLLAGLAIDDDSPEWLAAVERIMEGAIAGGQVDLARRMVELLPAVGAEGSRALALASRALIASWLAGAAAPDGTAAPDGGATYARHALGHAREAGAPWWMSRVIRLLARHGAATAAETAEAAAIDARLGIRP